MKASDFDFELPQELIAQQPVEGPRDSSRLMVLSRDDQTIAHRRFFELPEFLREGDVLVYNDSKVMPSRLLGQKAESRGKTELLLLRRFDDAADDEGPREVWEAMVGSRRTREGDGVVFGESGLKARIGEQLSAETWKVELNMHGREFRDVMDEIGRTPIPPYIKETPLEEQELRDKYQTIYAKHEGSAAAPTAGFHFSNELIGRLEKMVVERHPITLHVGLGTFAPVREDDVSKHKMHSEYAIVPDDTAHAVNMAKSTGRRIIAVGTTTVRTLESFMERGQLHAGQKWTDIFITPGYEFQCIDAMVTNFHLPKSTLLMLVAAFAGTDFIKAAYAEAVDKKYRFYSFGDAMFIA
ncbi:MAG: tRNA preQ1(34) S-adenosylmethionine ribosyltransferase-isomerase QueA [Candidatus Kerfeldbacteria bacterium]